MTSMSKISTIHDEKALNEQLVIPHPRLVDLFKTLDGDIMVIGVAGKMGPTLAALAVRASDQAGVNKKIYGVARFSDPASRDWLESHHVTTITCDLLQADQVSALPKIKNIIYMAGRKFSTAGSEELTWAMNTLAPTWVAEHFKESRIVVFSTGCVYKLVDIAQGGSLESDPPEPIGEYAQSCLGRERIFAYHCTKNNTPMLLYRLNYANDLRYGVLYDIAEKVWNDQPINLTVPFFNVIWQGDANNYALLALSACTVPATIMNITGPETVSTRYVAQTFGRLFGKKVRFEGDEGRRCYLSNAALCHRTFGYPHMPLEKMLQLQAAWLQSGGCGLGKPTHFEVTDGKY